MAGDWQMILVQLHIRTLGYIEMSDWFLIFFQPTAQA